MIARAKIHPLTGEVKATARAASDVGAQLMGIFQKRRANLSYDAARTGTDLDSHWSYSDSLDSDTSNNQLVRHTLMRRSRYEQGSNSYYSGIIDTYCNMLIGVGPTLRMLTKSRDFNEMVEREFYAWSQQIQLRRKLWCMAHAVTGDGEVLGILQTNPALPGVQLDLLPIEAEQCQSPFGNLMAAGYADGIKYDEAGNIQWYDILPYHPGSGLLYFVTEPLRVAPQNVLHWFKLKRPGAHRGIPAMTAGLNTGAYGRRFREATVAAAETAADFAAIATTQQLPAGDDEPDEVAPYMPFEIVKRMLTHAPAGWDINQLKAEHPNAQYSDFNRSLISELSRGLSMPYNVAACDSSTYSFASGKMDTLCFRAAIDVERQDCNDLILDPLFSMWFREWTLLDLRDGQPPSHEWAWPAHPIIDAVAEAEATTTRLKNGTLTSRKASSDLGADFNDELAIMAEDLFGEANDQTIAKARQIVALRNTPDKALPYVAQIMGLEIPQSNGASANEPAQVA